MRPREREATSVPGRVQDARIVQRVSSLSTLAKAISLQSVTVLEVLLRACYGKHGEDNRQRTGSLFEDDIAAARNGIWIYFAHFDVTRKPWSLCLYLKIRCVVNGSCVLEIDTTRGGREAKDGIPRRSYMCSDLRAQES